MARKHIAIIGGGPGGLMTAYLLEKRRRLPCDITIFEASGRLGGKIMTARFERAAVSYEAGAAELYDYSQLGPDPLREMIAEFKLPTSAMAGATVILNDHVLKTDADLERVFGKEAKRALRAFTRKARSHISPAEYYESDWKEDNEDPLARHSFASLLAKVPDAAARRYIAVATHSDLATENHQTNAVYGLQNFLMNEPDYMQLYTIDGGIDRLPGELARRLEARVLLHHPAVSVEKIQDSPPRYRVQTRHKGEIKSEDFDYVAVCLPNNWLPAIDWRGDKLAPAMRRHHAFYDYPAHYLRVSILFDSPFWRAQIAESFFMLDAFGGCCVYDESSRQDAGRSGVLGWLLAGEAAATMSNFSDDDLIQQVLDSLPRSLRHGRGLFLEGRVHRWIGTVNGLPGGFPAREPDSRHIPEPVEHPGLFVVGDYLFDSTLNGVLDSADVVAEWILDYMDDAVQPAVNGSAALPAEREVVTEQTLNGSIAIPLPEPETVIR